MVARYCWQLQEPRVTSQTGGLQAYTSVTLKIYFFIKSSRYRFLIGCSVDDTDPTMPFKTHHFYTLYHSVALDTRLCKSISNLWLFLTSYVEHYTDNILFYCYSRLCILLLTSMALCLTHLTERTTEKTRSYREPMVP